MDIIGSRRFQPLPFKRAYEYALKAAEWIAPYCLQIEPVGEIRRHCATCKEIALLTIPKFVEGKHLLFDFLDEYVNNSKGTATWEHSSGALGLAGSKPPVHSLNARLFLPKCAVQIHCARPDNWFLRLFESTGSTKHYLTMADLVRDIDGHWYYGKCLSVRHRDVIPKSEGEIYELVKQPFLMPPKRS
jgi:hypothetical protein